MAVAAAGVVTSYPCVHAAAGAGGRSSPVDQCYDDDNDDYCVELSRLHQSQSAAALHASSFAVPASYCGTASQMRSGATHLHSAGGIVRAAALHTAPPGPCTATQTALQPYTAVGFALSPADMMRQPPLAGFQGIHLQKF